VPGTVSVARAVAVLVAVAEGVAVAVGWRSVVSAESESAGGKELALPCASENPSHDAPKPATASTESTAFSELCRSRENPLRAAVMRLPLSIYGSDGAEGEGSAPRVKLDEIFPIPNRSESNAETQSPPSPPTFEGNGPANSNCWESSTLLRIPRT
jgi:hypothetical protein